MEGDSTNEEALREASSVGNVEEITNFIELGVNINSTNKVNGWSALHWASKRGHSHAVEILLQAGADKNIHNNKGEIPADLTRKSDVRKLLGAPPMEDTSTEGTPESHDFKPNYLANPGFIYSKADHHKDTSRPISVHYNGQRNFYYQPQSVICTAPTQWAPAGLVITPFVLVLRVRLDRASTMNNDYVYVEINRQNAPTLSELKKTLCNSLDMGIDPKQVREIRVLPQTMLRNDEDVLRLTDYQALEVVLQPDALNPFDGSIVSLSNTPGSAASSDSKYLREYASKLVY